MILHGDSLEILKTLKPNSVDAIVTDPPYGLSFMGKKWDYDVPSIDMWREVFRVLKPGAHLLSFGGTRTYHRLASAIEDAGFEIRDQLQWIYGSGFPKSQNVGLAIDKQAGVIGNRGHGFNAAGQGISLNQNKELRSDHPDYKLPEHITDEAKQWQGWGTALKPANEPIVLARKPLSEKTVAKNVLRWGTGALNIDGSRIGMLEAKTYSAPDIRGNKFNSDVSEKERHIIHSKAQGRWPANLILDESAAEMLDEQSGVLGSGGNKSNCKTSELHQWTGTDNVRIKDGGQGASRFFYVAKASKRERNAGLEGMPEKESTKQFMVGMTDCINSDGVARKNAPIKNQNHHPTVKPIKLMEYLCRLITPPGGVILDPFCGSGSTGVAAIGLGFKFIGIEKEKEYCDLAEKRIENVKPEIVKELDEQTCMSI